MMAMLKIVAGLMLFEIIHLLGTILLTGPGDRENFKQCYLMAFDFIVTFMFAILVLFGCIAILVV